MTKKANFRVKESKGITLIALVVTIIVLIILAGISINLILGDNGIITKAKEARKAQEIAEIKENVQMKIVELEMQKLQNGQVITQAEIETILQSQNLEIIKNEDGTIKSIKPVGKDYEIPYEQIYRGQVSQNAPVVPETPVVPEVPPTIAETPEKSEVAAFSRANGVIEIEFLQGTGYTTTTMPNEPNLGTNMKKVYWEDDGTEKIEGTEGFDSSKWYSYTEQTGATTSGGTSKWANAVTVDSQGKVTGYFVWIPRYAYRIVYFDTETNENNYRTNGTTTGIVGYSDARGLVHPDGTTPLDMEAPVKRITEGENKLRPHPAFEDGSETGYTQGEWNTKLEGIWIAKYETSGSLTDMKVLPGVQAIASQTIGDMYSNALNFSTANKSHMLKNSEWGAMAYLTESKYGRNGTPVTQNSAGFYTAGSEGATVKSNPLQSTTGNYYGIYGAVGGANEYVTGYIADSSTSNGNSFASTNNTNNKTTSTEYATVYNMLSSSAKLSENYNKNVNKKFGDATIEISTAGTGNTSWNSATSCFVGVDSDKYWPFFLRGGTYTSGRPGILYFYYGCGRVDINDGFRLSLSIM